MGFTLDIHLPEGGADKPVNVVGWLVPIRQYVGWNVPVLQLSIDGRPFELVCNMPAVIHQTPSAPGDVVGAGDRLATVEAEGDEIPYGRANARIEAAG
jgi:hypothetical protein